MMFSVKIPKLRYPVSLFLVCAVFSVFSAYTQGPVWLSLSALLWALIFGVIGLFTLLDWIAHKVSERIRELTTARHAGSVSLAVALKGLTSEQTQAVLAGERVALLLIPGDEEPILFIRGMTKNIPWEWARDFFELSKDVDPFLWPIWKSSNEAFATDFTRLIIAQGWAVDHKGPYSAKLTKPLKWVAARFWIDLDDLEEIEEASG